MPRCWQIAGAAISLAIVSVPSSWQVAANGASANAGGLFIQYRRQGGLVPIVESWTLAGDGRLVASDGAAYRMPSSAVAHLRQVCESIAPGTVSATDPACADCYETHIRLLCHDGERLITVTEGTPTVPSEIADLLQRFRSGIRSSRPLD